MIEIRSRPRRGPGYSFALYSRPPTNRLASLERDILEFIAERLKCVNRQGRVQNLFEKKPIAIPVNYYEKRSECVNFASLQRQRDADAFETNVVALDRDQRMIEIRSVPGAGQRYSFALYSRPPTNRLASLERDILEFISERLKSVNRQVQRHENSEEQRDFFEIEAGQNLFLPIVLYQCEGFRILFEEADRMNGRLPL